MLCAVSSPVGVVPNHDVAQTGKAIPNNLFHYPVKLLQFVSSFGYVGVSSSLMLNTLLIVTPATIAFSWLFFQFCEKPYMRKTAVARNRRQEQDQEARLEPRVLALKVSAESEM
ncbi:MAG TPA: hypothetical protein VES69_09390 [Pyrinomonadaceae bacterium]|nr:hypothetical protein [Pyrinomonadaceae bacterium]